MSERPRILVFASGDAEGGGSGFENLIHNSNMGHLGAEIVGVVSNHKDGGVKKIAERFDITFLYMDIKVITRGRAKGTPEYRKALEMVYQGFSRIFNDPFVALSGWVFFVDPDLPYDDDRYLVFQIPVPIKEGDTAETLGQRVNLYEHAWQAFVTHLIVTGQIYIKNGKVVVPDWYNYLTPIDFTLKKGG